MTFPTDSVPQPSRHSEPAPRGTPGECCCPVVFGGRVTAGHCPIHGAAVLGEDGAAEAHAIDRRRRMHVFPVRSDDETPSDDWARVAAQKRRRALDERGEG